MNQTIQNQRVLRRNQQMFAIDLLYSIQQHEHKMVIRDFKVAVVFIILASCCLLLYINSHISQNGSSVQNLNIGVVDSMLNALTNLQHISLTNIPEGQRIVIFFGTRPEIIKLAPVIKCLKQYYQQSIITVFTGQHDDIIRPFIRLFDINVDIWFNTTLEKGQSLNMLTGKLFMQIDQILTDAEDIWVVQGDTTSAMVISTVAFHKKIRVAHIEAGLRTFNMYSPFPEEYNRKTISSIATYHFAATETNRKNLLNEGIDNSSIFVTGNTIIDAVRYVELKNRTKVPNVLLGKTVKLLVLVTLHRRENINRMHLLYKCIASVKCAKCLFLVPIHPNPHATRSAKSICRHDSRFVCVSPLSYEEVLWMLGHSAFIITDSGGLQEEATWYNVPTLVLRKNTERREAIDAGVAQLVDEISVIHAMTQVIRNLHTRNKSKIFPYGDGRSAGKILKILQLANLPVANIMRRPLETVQLHEPENITQQYFNKLKKKKIPTIAVILQVFKRETLQNQLLAVARQTLVPNTVVILQNSNFSNISAIIRTFRSKHSTIETLHIASSKNLRFHGRFHIAYMLTEDYVSIWDDDIVPRTEWLQFCIDYSRLHEHCLVGANGRTFKYIDSKNGYKVVQSEREGRNDFVGHSWTLPRVYLRYYLNMEPITLYSGEDIQLSYALQQYGISSYKPPFAGEKSVEELQARSDANASYKSNETPRLLLICIVLKHNFKCLRCRNCSDKTLIDQCIAHHQVKAGEIANKTFQLDKQWNVHAWS